MYQRIKVGVTGHRYHIDNEVYERLFSAFSQFLKERQGKVLSVISSLADGADRVVAQYMMQQYGADLIVPLPFEEEIYRKDFSIESQKEFDTLMSEATMYFEVASLKTDSRESGYLQAGKAVVDSCDILLAVWDGKPARGVGGTGDIVMYARKRGRDVMFIDIETLIVDSDNIKEGKNGNDHKRDISGIKV
jgi:hypothetical protein